MKAYNLEELRSEFRKFARKNSRAACESVLDSVVKETWIDAIMEALGKPRLYELIREHDGTVWLTKRLGKRSLAPFKLPLYWAAHWILGYEYRSEQPPLEEVFLRFEGEPPIKRVTPIGMSVGDGAVKLMSEVPDPSSAEPFSKTWKQFVDHCLLYDGLPNAGDRRYYWIEYTDGSVEVRVGVYGLEGTIHYRARGYVPQRA